ncbi:MAG: alpha/beta fold hydrolase [Actinobacteria bacterium]|nr:alpha/beta fold hydrolase [Actinomycetota bacterium]
MGHVPGRDVALPSVVLADGTRPDLVLVHGFTQGGRSWTPVVDGLLTTGRRIVAVDLPGHGATDPSLDRSDLTTTAGLLAAATGPATYVGYSMGGRVALRLALDRPDLVEGLVLLGATAGIDDPADRAARRTADADLADHVEDVRTEAFVDEWLAQPLFASLEPSTHDLLARRANRPEGLAASLRAAGTGTMDPTWWDELGSLAMPVLLMTGALDAKFTAIAERMAAAIGENATRVEVPDAGHAAHLERPGATAAAIADWLATG